MTTAWLNSNLKTEYESGELIVVNGKAIESLPKNTKLILVQEGKNERIQLEAKKGPGGAEFYEFYIVESGKYQLQSTRGTASFTVVPRQVLNFQREFGIFFAVVVALVLLMAWRYLRKSPQS